MSAEVVADVGEICLSRGNLRYDVQCFAQREMRVVRFDAERVENKRVNAFKAVNGTLSAIVDALKEGDKVSLVGFGTFEVRERPERKGRNPQTKEEITIPASKLPAFKAGKALKDAVQ